jgi:hypothetical protein
VKLIFSHLNQFLRCFVDIKMDLLQKEIARKRKELEEANLLVCLK